MNRRFRSLSGVVTVMLLIAVTGNLNAARESNVSETPHNLSISGTGAVIANTEDQICVFCHTPHGATSAPGAPLWNRSLSTATYTTYLSSSIDADLVGGQLDQPAGSSKLCLSCHDGTLAIGSVNVKGGQTGVTFTMSGDAADGSMPAGLGVVTGFTRDLDIDLSNDHPVSVTYDQALADRDGELRMPDVNQNIPPGVGDIVGLRDHAVGVRPLLPLEPTGPAGRGQIQCATCHDPHVRDTQADKNIKFLRSNRYQEGTPSGGNFNKNADIICLACHDKNLDNADWSVSAHANPTVANEEYNTVAAALRDFPSNARVWEMSCLNCHDTHTVAGARRLVREGTDSSSVPKAGGGSAIEEGCYQCHTNDGQSILNASSSVPNIEDTFALDRHMPITTSDQQANFEVHDIGTGTNGVEGTERGRDFVESQDLLGKLDQVNRHAECTDCHNPHRVIRNFLFNGNAVTPDAAGTHRPGGVDGNLASGVLRGTWGVEPNYGSSNFLSLPLSYTLKRGSGNSESLSASHLTREYQLCFKCHSDYAYLDSGIYPNGGRPKPGDSSGGTPPGTNQLNEFTNQAMEFQAPIGDKGEGSGNHRSWHPVVDDTGRSLGDRSIGGGNNPWLSPFNTLVGSQTMYCSDCHGPSTAATTINSNGGENGEPWGPHGSQNDFILKGTWDRFTGGNSRQPPATDPNNGLCFKCHDFEAYTNRNGDDNFDSGFSGPKSNNLHAFHADKIEKMHCNWCHVAVPHGWKNKAFLVNLNDVGPEAGLSSSGNEIPIDNSGDTYNAGPYYNNAKLKIRNFRSSGTWRDSDCGSASGDPDVGRDWMKDVCENPP